MPHTPIRPSGTFPHKAGEGRRSVLLGAAAALIAGRASAQNPYPDRTIKLVVGYPPGGPNDLLARILAPKLAELLKQTVVIDNRGGSNGEIAAAMVAKAPADGYTILFSSNGPVTVAPALGRKLPYDPATELSAIMPIGASPMLLVVRPDLPAKDVKELIALAKAAPGKLNGASAGTGGMTHLGLELFKSVAGVDIVHVPYKGGGPAMTDLMAGQVDIYFGGVPTALPHVRSGKLRGLAVTSLARLAGAAEIPTLHESGLSGFDAGIWYGVFGPPNLPAPVLSTLRATFATVMADADVKRYFVDNAVDALPTTPERFAQFAADDFVKWQALAKRANISAD
ncbi:MAG: tripartite tricarboxylate transporter substrate binding protein [Alphaproteobacteria bacterium]|nr:tripartite tricarboxylate transporter substrate binding protein [Alphaproteobacteria bacterium]